MQQTSQREHLMLCLRRALLALFVPVALTVTACKPKPPVPVLKHADGTVVEAPAAPTEAEELAALAMWKEVERLRAEGKQAEADAELQVLIETYPATDAAARGYESIATTLAKGGDVEGAIAAYEKLLFYRPGFARINEARAHYAELLMQVGRHSDAAPMLRALYAAEPDPAKKAALGQQFAQSLAESGESVESLKLWVSLHADNPTDAALQARAAENALALVKSGISFREAEGLWSDAKGDAEWRFIRAAVAYRLAKIYYHTRQFDESKDMLSKVVVDHGDSEYAEGARGLLALLQARFRTNPQVIGVALPLSGRYRQFGERSLEAIKLAFGPNAPFTLAVEDTAGSPEQASKAVEKLVLEHSAIAIVGPIFSKAASAAALKAEELSVPVLTLSHKNQLPDIGPYVLRTALTVQAQAKALATVAFEKLGFKSFAFLYPNTRYGKDFINAFWDEVDARQGQVRGIESYELNQKTFSAPAGKLVGRHYLWARQDYRDKVDELKAMDLPSHRLSAALEKFQKSLPPIIDFDAIVMPSSGKDLGLLAPALAVEDIVMTKNPEELEKIRMALGVEELKPVTLLGASTWNNQKTLEGCDHHCEGAVFVDAYYANNPSTRVRDFVSAFRERTGAEPSLSEAQAYDTAVILRRILNQRKPGTREALLNELLSMDTYKGVTGKMRFDDQGEALRQLFILTVEDGAIDRWRGKKGKKKNRKATGGARKGGREG